MPEIEQPALKISPDIQQPLIVSPGDILPWRAVCSHDEITAAEASVYKARLRPFTMPGANSAPVDNVVVHPVGLSFNEPGFYFFSLPCACLKVLVKAPGLDGLERCVEIADFVSSCTVHSLADHHRVVVGNTYDLRPALAKQFVSDQPQAFHCGEVAVFTIYLLASQGIAAKWMWLGQRPNGHGHIVCFVPIDAGGVVLDADFGVAIPLTPDQLLAGRADGFARVPFVPLGPKKFLIIDHELNQASRSGWTWNPGFASKHVTFDPDEYRAMLTEFCLNIEIREPVCDPEGGFRFMPTAANGPLVEVPPGADPRLSFEESARSALDQCDELKRSQLAAVLARVDASRVEQIRAKYATEIAVRFPRDPASEIKYLDIPYWLSHKLDLVMRLGLHASPAIDILDIGTGGSHFLAVCQAFGHRGMGIDIAEPLYADIAHCLGVRRLVERVDPGKPLLARGGKFDLVTAIWVSFNSLPSQDGRRAYWTLDDWAFLLKDLIDNQLRLPGRIHFELNQEYNDDTPPVGRFNPDLLAMLKGQGAKVDEERGYITLDWPARPELSAPAACPGPSEPPQPATPRNQLLARILTSWPLRNRS